MAGPITLKASSYPATAATLQGVRELSSAEMRDHIAFVITNKFAGDHDGTGTAELDTITGSLTSGYTEVGTFTNRERNEAVGTHPAGGATTSTTYRIQQKNTVVSESGVVRPLRFNGKNIEEMADGEIDTELLDEVIAAMVFEDANTVGQYQIKTSSPTGGTWAVRDTITETQVDGTDVAYNLYQKTAPTTAAATNINRLVKSDGNGGSAEMTDAEMETLVSSFRNRIIASGIGTYLLNSGSPSASGTWAQMGSTFTDQLKTIASANYAGGYTGSYTGYYNRFFSGFLNGAYAGSYSGTYTGYYAGNTIQSSSSTQETKALFVRTA